MVVRQRREPFEMFGVECGEGWKKLYQPLLDLCTLYGATVLQVKEKFGGLRFYFMGPPLKEGEPDRSEWLQAIVDAAEAASYHTCELCGEDGVAGHDDDGRPIYKAKPNPTGWIKTLCEPCKIKWDERK